MDIPVPIMKGYKYAMALFIYHDFNNSPLSPSFPTPVSPVFKKDNKQYGKLQIN